MYSMYHECLQSVAGTYAPLDRWWMIAGTYGAIQAWEASVVGPFRGTISGTKVGQLSWVSTS